MKRGDIIIVAPAAPFDKPRPALIVQASVLETNENVTVALITSDFAWNPGIRVAISPTSENGLRKPSEIMIDLLVTLPVGRIGGLAGTADAATMKRVDQALRFFLGLGPSAR